jgi:hypothetical protein
VGPSTGAPPGAVLNNTGLAIGVTTRIPSAGAGLQTVLLTSDANHDSVPPAAFPLPNPLTGTTAVHHGSNRFGAAQNQRAPAVAAGGRIAYSCGVMGQGPARPYGFPNVTALGNWRGALWTMDRSTAEGANINANPPAVAGRGNIQMGVQTPLPAVFANTAFFNFPIQLA